MLLFRSTESVPAENLFLHFDNALLAVGKSGAEAICEGVLSLDKRSAAAFARLLFA